MCLSWVEEAVKVNDDQGLNRAGIFQLYFGRRFLDDDAHENRIIKNVEWNDDTKHLVVNNVTLIKNRMTNLRLAMILSVSYRLLHM